MPTMTRWVDPQLVLEHQGVHVFKTYKDDDVDQGANRRTFTTVGTNDEEAHRFDVGNLNVPSRALLNGHPPYLSDSDERFKHASSEQRTRWQGEWDAWHAGGEDAAIRVVLKDAIDAGLLPTARSKAFAESGR